LQNLKIIKKKREHRLTKTLTLATIFSGINDGKKMEKIHKYFLLLKINCIFAMQ